MRPRRFILPQAGTGGYGIRPYIFCGGRSSLAEAVPRVELSPFVESEIRRGAFYMRPRRFILPQAGTGGYGIRPLRFLWRAEALAEAVPRVELSPFVESEIWGRILYAPAEVCLCRKRARADMESAPTFFVAGGGPRRRRCSRVEFSPFVENETVGAHSICARGSLPLPQAGTGGYGIRPTFFVAGGVPRRGGASRGAFSLCRKRNRRGAFYMRPRRFILPQAGTGGYGIRPLHFLWRAESPQRRCPAWSCLPLLKARSVGAHSICARGGLSYRKRARADMESAPTFL